MASPKYNILYGRLSQEDERQGESNSIHNQKLFLEKYAADNGLRTPYSCLTTDTPGPTSTGPRGRKSWR